MSRGVPFAAGNKMGRGRPRGSRNKSSLVCQHLLDEYGEPLVRKCIAMALKEDSVAMRVCMERLLPVRRDPPVQVKLPPIRTAEEVSEALNVLVQAICRGRLTPGESKQIAEILEGKRRMIETVELEQRIQKLESSVENDSGGKPPAR